MLGAVHKLRNRGGGREVVPPNDFGVVYSIQKSKELAQLLVIESHRGRAAPDGADNQSTYQ